MTEYFQRFERSRCEICQQPFSTFAPPAEHGDKIVHVTCVPQVVILPSMEIL